MLRTFIVAAAVLACAPMAYAQSETETEAQQPEAAPAPAPAPVRMAIPRSEAPPRPAPSPRTETPRAEPVRAAQPAAATAQDDEQRRAVPRARPRGDNPPIGTAVPREEAQRPAPAPPVTRNGGDNRGAGRTVYVAPPVYNNYYYYPRRYYPYGYGAFGLGYFYYDPYTWYPRSYSAYGGYGAGYPGYYPGRAYSVFDVGELRLSVTPRQAQVFVDGYFAGEVDDYDGLFQAMKLESGPYHIEIVAPGYETLEFDVRINPGQKINYRGDLRRRP